MPRLNIPLKLHKPRTGGWHTHPLGEEDGNAHVELDMRFNGPHVDGPVVEEWVFAERNSASSLFDCFDWMWNWNKRRRKRETEKTKTICTSMCDRMNNKLQDACDRVAVIDDVIRDKVRNKDKAGAKQALIGKKRLVKQIATYEAYKRDLDMLNDSLDQTEDQKAFIKEMKSANKVLKKQKLGKAIDSVEGMLDDMDDHRQDMEEFHSTLTSRTAGGDDELEDELAQLFGERVEPIVIPAFTDLDLVDSMPLPPTHQAAVETLAELDKMTAQVTI